MISILPKRPVSSSFPKSPKKRTKTPSPQRPIYKGVYNPTKTPFVLRLNEVTLTSPASIAVKKVSDSGSADVDPFGKSPLSFFSFSETKDDSVDVSMTTEIEISVEKEGDRTAPCSCSDILPTSIPLVHLHADSPDSSGLTGNSPFSPYSYIDTAAAPNPKSIEMPFTLVSETGVQRHPLRHEVRMLRDIWPEIRTVILMPPYLTLFCDTIPLTTPKTIAGVPCHFTRDENDIPLHGTFCRGEPIMIGEKQDVWVLPTHSTRVSILEFLAPLGVCSIAWLGTRWLLEVDSVTEDTKKQLPCLINGLVASFRQYAKPKDHSLSRAKISASIDFDDTNYFPHLHAGMLLSDGERITTSGCPVFHPNDPNQYFTIASHGFVTGAEVRHPLGNSRIIGIADKKFGETDISLCCITDSQINYTVDCFAGNNDGIILRKMMKEEGVWIGKELFFDSPFTGLGTGYVVAHGTRAIPSDSQDLEFQYVANLWVSFDYGGDDPKEGCCGSPLFDKDGDVYAFFHYADNTATSYCPTPDPLIDAGYDIGNVSTIAPSQRN